MKEDGEYLEFEPGYDQCYNFFRDLNPKKWKSKAKKTELRSLKSKLSQLFDKKTEQAKKYLLQTDITSQFTHTERRRGAQIQLQNVHFNKQGKFDEPKTDFQIRKDLNEIFKDDNFVAKILKTRLKQELLSKMYPN